MQFHEKVHAGFRPTETHVIPAFPRLADCQRLD